MDRLINRLNKSKKEEITNYEFRIKADQKKRKIYQIGSIAITFIIFTAFSLATQDYSITKTIILKLEKIKAPFDYLFGDEYIQKLINSFFGLETDDYAPLLKNFIKYAPILFISYVSFQFLSIRDPFSNVKKIKSGLIKSYFFPWIKDLNIYKELMPSNIFYTICGVCQQKETCNNIIHRDTETDNKRLWNKIYAQLDASTIENNSKILFSIRKNFFIKYIALIMAIGSLFVIYPLIRFVEYMMGLPIKWFNPDLWWFSSFLFATYLIWQYFIFPRDKDVGLWKKFHENLIDLVSNDNFISIFSDERCDTDDTFKNIIFSGKGRSNPYKAILDLIVIIENRYIDDTLDGVCYSFEYKKIVNKKILDYVKTINEIMQKLYNNTCRTTVFIKDEGYLIPFISVPLMENAKKTSFRHLENSHHETFSLSKQESLVCQSWVKQTSMAKISNDIKYLYTEQKKHLKSIISVPIAFNKSDVICSICIDSPFPIFNKETLSRDNDLIVKVGQLIAIELQKADAYKEECDECQ